MTITYIGIGANLNNPKKRVQMAIADLEKLPDTNLLIHSSLYRSQPLGPQNQPDYINAVAAFETRLSPYELLRKLQQLETQQGRQRNYERWGSRVIDLDILLYGDIQMQGDDLIIPHPQLAWREFVLYPLAEITRNLILPAGKSLLTLKAQCSIRNMMSLSNENSCVSRNV
ncbi:2-amino-4-hydroxy-6-hydroxymethyldihydropteridine diphosphokinase [Coxiella endosymbiont of Amblyomma nuttalli]|uniref:2-amino-4-hydroxy-6- hydroxymethyldihydropteridine diphosphokinase n=1 Tax=Coxiella endosymbiont of Amblyomma nuttalli TaxID=2749996 RepID=UPI001BAC5600|nr:2-amino-4-hydroxy-6-hydroxymethyldihydropteridine diphosphokinase [Coxiella endosymbiont of Amblyomma nuttalli]QTS83822.1 2-amino-4-hydroxy-6-hydroxymethyldihydropteridine pyrophosphokinase [Coxiella endosymbiont of Amblyomma nuttalli]